MSGHVTGWGWYWLGWFVIGFGLPEFYWLAVNTANTLSRKFWGFEALNLAHPFDFADWTWLHYALGVLFALGLSWLFVHLIFGLLR